MVAGTLPRRWHSLKNPWYRAIWVTCPPARGLVVTSEMNIWFIESPRMDSLEQRTWESSTGRVVFHPRDGHKPIE